MAFQLSPGVLVTEKDLTSIVPAVATSTGGFAGSFMWGPVMDPTLITSENQLVARFGKPTTSNAGSWFTAANFLAYTSNLQLVRADTNGARNAVVQKSGTVTAINITGRGFGWSTSPVVAIAAPGLVGGITATATATLTDSGRVTGASVVSGGSDYVTPVVTLGAPNLPNGTQATATATVVGGVVTAIVITNAGIGYTTAPSITVTGGGTGFSGTVAIELGKVISGFNILNPGFGYSVAPSIAVTDTTGSGFTGTTSIAQTGVKINNESDYIDSYINGAGVVGEFAAKYPGTLGNSIAVSIADSNTFTAWSYKDEFDSAPGSTSYALGLGGSNDELHIIVIDSLGLWTGVRGEILEKFAFVSKASDSRKSDGANNYYRDVINANSKYLWWMDHPESGTNWGNPSQGTAYTNLSAIDVITATSGGVVMSGGVDDLAPTDGQIQDGFAIFQNAELYDISLVPTGNVSAAVAKWVVENVAEVRKDCVAFVSPVDISTGEVIQGADATERTIAFRQDASFNVNSSYAVLDTGYKYQYDRYNDVYRWVPLNGDIAGLCARTDYTNDPWWSPGGLNRGQIKNVVKLAFNPTKTERDELYKNGVNPVVTLPGQGTILFGDKTLLARPSAFDRINVRRLFIVLEKAIATAAKYQLFEFNDPFTRAQFRSLVDPFLRDVQGRRGIIDFRVKCDESNNTGEVIDRNEFLADIFIKPARSINFITLNFIAARTGISFEEIGG